MRLAGLAAVDAGPSVTDWIQVVTDCIQVVAAASAILVATWVALRVSRQEHERQVWHQARQDMARAVNVIHRLYPAFATGELIEALGVSDSSDDDHRELENAERLLQCGTAELRSVANVLQLTAPSVVHPAATALLESVGSFHEGIARVRLFESLKNEGSSRAAPVIPFVDLHDQIQSAEKEFVRIGTEGPQAYPRGPLQRLRFGRQGRTESST